MVGLCRQRTANTSHFEIFGWRSGRLVDWLALSSEIVTIDRSKTFLYVGLLGHRIVSRLHRCLTLWNRCGDFMGDWNWTRSPDDSTFQQEQTLRSKNWLTSKNSPIFLRDYTFLANSNFWISKPQIFENSNWLPLKTVAKKLLGIIKFQIFIRSFESIGPRIHLFIRNEIKLINEYLFNKNTTNGTSQQSTNCQKGR